MSSLILTVALALGGDTIASFRDHASKGVACADHVVKLMIFGTRRGFSNLGWKGFSVFCTHVFSKKKKKKTIQHKNKMRRGRGNVSRSRTTCFVTVFVWTLAEVISVRLTSRPEAAHIFLRSHCCER